MKHTYQAKTLPIHIDSFGHVNNSSYLVLYEEARWDILNKGQGIIWEGKGLNEVGRRGDTGEIIVRVDPRYFRPTEVDNLIGDSSKAKIKLGWFPKISLEELVREMTQFDLKKSKEEKTFLEEVN